MAALPVRSSFDVNGPTWVATKMCRISARGGGGEVGLDPRELVGAEATEGGLAVEEADGLDVHVPVEHQEVRGAIVEGVVELVAVEREDAAEELRLVVRVM